ncbi:ABC transporter permease [Kiloniella sp. b19]|uniref:ABC transporter permease n=1 Tax=Kiloniella sp. GXU_MW_B19 TaxID=3141326 RepID=UPI0031DFB0DC
MADPLRTVGKHTALPSRKSAANDQQLLSSFSGGKTADGFASPWLRVMPGFTLLLFLTPILLGLLGTLLPSFGYFPALNAYDLHLEVWQKLFDMPGLAGSIRLSLTTGILATTLSFFLACLFLAAFQHRNWFARVQAVLAPLLAIPHSALAIGLVFVIAPSGWIVRLLSPWLTGWDLPPDLITVQDPRGLSLVFALVLKETPYLILMGLSIAPQLQQTERMRVAASLGYSPMAGWFKVIFPDFYRLMRLPLMAVLAFSLSVVDMALIIGPGTPPPLSVLVLRWYLEPDLGFRLLAAAGGLLQLGLVLGTLLFWFATSPLLARALRNSLTNGKRQILERLLPKVSMGSLLLLVGTALLSMISLLFWSFSKRWSYPNVLPDSLTTRTWERQTDTLIDLGLTTIILGLAASCLAIALSLACLELEKQRNRNSGQGSLYLLYMPLLIPQVTFLFGIQILLISLGLDGTWIAVIWLHLIFVLPYAFLSLSDAYHQQDNRYGQIALSLGHTRWTTFFRVRLPLLIRPVCFTLALGFAVSAAQYLPTLLGGTGRITTLATEAVSLASGGNRRVVSVVTLLYSFLPLLAFALALLLPSRLYPHSSKQNHANDHEPS